MERTQCPAADVSVAAPGSASGAESPPSERELLSALLEAQVKFTAMVGALLPLLGEIAAQNATLIELLAEQSVDQDAEPTQYLSGAPVR